ncbi:MAG: hydantoinase B/oxoprolinase family protein [Dongiaceae bacterium]
MTVALPPGLDPITFAVVKSALDSIVDDMAYTVMRTARSAIVRDVLDYSTTLTDPQGRIVTQAKTVALHLGAVPDAMAVVLGMYGDDLHPGDVIILNDPYAGGMHLPDIFMIKPIFHADALQGFSVVIAHHCDMGGRVPGSNASDSTEIYQEGLRIPPTKLYEADRPNRTLLRLIESNVRLPALVLGDLQAQLAACRLGEAELLKLLARHGAAATQTYLAALIDYAERLTRDAISGWPKGTWRFTDHIDEDGLDDRPIPIVVAITVAGDHLTVDFAGSAPQVRGAINSTLSFVKSAAYLSVRCALERDVPNNEGVFRCITVKAPEGSILNPLSPAPVAARALTGYRVVDAMFGCLAQIVPRRMPAAGEGGNTVVCLGGYDRARKPFVVVDMINGAWGGRPAKDGIEGITNPSQNMSNTPVEVLEAKAPVRIERYGFVPDSGGPGRFRGGLGLIRDYRLLADEAVLQLRADRQRFRPFGLAGGGEGAPTRNVLNPGTAAETELPAKVTMRLKAGDVIRHEQSGGGGHGELRPRPRRHRPRPRRRKDHAGLRPALSWLRGRRPLIAERGSCPSSASR